MGNDVKFAISVGSDSGGYFRLETHSRQSILSKSQRLGKKEGEMVRESLKLIVLEIYAKARTLY